MSDENPYAPPLQQSATALKEPPRTRPLREIVRNCTKLGVIVSLVMTIPGMITMTILFSVDAVGAFSHAVDRATLEEFAFRAGKGSGSAVLSLVGGALFCGAIGAAVGLLGGLAQQCLKRWTEATNEKTGEADVP
jgi:hypothetical protein